MNRVSLFLVLFLSLLPNRSFAETCENSIRMAVIFGTTAEFCDPYGAELRASFEKALAEAKSKKCSQFDIHDYLERHRKELTEFISKSVDQLGKAKTCTEVIYQSHQYMDDSKGVFKFKFNAIAGNETQNSQSSSDLSKPSLVFRNAIEIMPIKDNLLPWSPQEIKKRRKVNDYIGNTIKIEKDMVLAYDDDAYAKGGKFIIMFVTKDSSPSSLKCYLDGDDADRFLDKGLERRFVSIKGYAEKYDDDGLILNPCMVEEIKK